MWSAMRLGSPPVSAWRHAGPATCPCAAPMGGSTRTTASSTGLPACWDGESLSSLARTVSSKVGRGLRCLVLLDSVMHIEAQRRTGAFTSNSGISPLSNPAPETAAPPLCPWKRLLGSRIQGHQSKPGWDRTQVPLFACDSPWLGGDSGHIYPPGQSPVSQCIQCGQKGTGTVVPSMAGTPAMSGEVAAGKASMPSLCGTVLSQTKKPWHGHQLVSMETGSGDSCFVLGLRGNRRAASFPSR